jgi:hypothetical protein
MIAQRFRPVGWVAGIALAATALYLVSLQVASERGRLEAIDRKIAATKREIRQLQTEMGTRASLRQLERWNGEVLALSAPQAGQYLSGEAGLDTLNRDEIGRKPSTPPPVMVAVTPDASKPIEKTTPSALFAALTTPKAPPKLTAQDRTVQAAIATKPSLPRPARTDIALIDRGALTRLAMGERVTGEIKGKTKP